MVCVLLMWNAPAHAWVCTVVISGSTEAVGETVTLTATVDVPGGSFSWSITQGLAATATSDTYTFTGSAPGTVVISVTYHNPKGRPCTDDHVIKVIAPELIIVRPQATWTFITTEERLFVFENPSVAARISPERIHTQFASAILWELPADPTSGPTTTLTGQGETWTPQIDVPPHGKKGRPGPLSYTFKAHVTIFGRTWEASPVTVRQLSPDPVRQQYVDHRDGPTSSMGSGGSWPSWRGSLRISRRGSSG